MENYLNQFKPVEMPLLGYIKVPKYQIDKEEAKLYNLQEGITSDEFLTKLADHFFEEKLNKGMIPRGKEEIYRKQVKYELETIAKLQFTDYVLLIYDIIKFCKKNDILNGPGRGSCGGSTLFYILGIVSADPIKYNLLFERFISSARTEVKDFGGEIYIKSSNIADVDIDSDRNFKPLINKYLEEKFPNKTCKILNLSTLTGKILIKDCGKTIGSKTEEEMMEVSSYIESNFGKVEDIQHSYENTPKFKEWCDKNPQIYNIALKLRGLIRGKSVHASGVFISNEVLKDSIPTELTKDKELVTGYSMDDCQLLGIKVDNLGLKNLGAIHECLKEIGLKIEDVDVNDPDIYTFLNNSDDYYGIFQAEEGLGKKTLKKIKPQNIDDISISIAAARPGSYLLIDDLIAYRENNDTKLLDKFPDRIKHIVRETGGLCIFQETLMSLTRAMGNFTPQESDEIRKCISKKKVKEMPKWKDRFINQSIENGFEKTFCEWIWDDYFIPASNYSFNRSHSTSYSFLLAITAYLKSKYPLVYYKHLLNYSKHEQNPIAEITVIEKELKNSGIKLLPPHLIKSKLNFSIEGNDIRFGLLSIKGISDKTIEKINNFRAEYNNKFEIFQKAEEAGLSISIISSLIMSKALDYEGMKVSRAKLVLEAQSWNLLTDKEKEYTLMLAKEFDYDFFKIVKELTIRKDEKGKPLMKAPENIFLPTGIVDKNLANDLINKKVKCRFLTFYKDYQKYREIYDKNSRNNEFCEWFFMQRLTGYTSGKTLKDIFIKEVPELQLINSLKDEPDGKDVKIIGTVKEANLATSKNKNKYLKLLLQDETAELSVMLFNKKDFKTGDEIDRIANCRHMNAGKLPQEDDIVVIEGQKKGDVVFGSKITVQNLRIFTRFGDIEKENKKEKELTKTEKTG